MMCAMNGAMSMLNKIIYFLTCIFIWMFLPIAVIVIAFKASLAYVDDAVLTIHMKIKDDSTNNSI
jgi:hypothetical protein